MTTMLMLIFALGAPAPKAPCNEQCVINWCHLKCLPDGTDEDKLRKHRKCYNECTEFYDKNGCRERPECRQDV